MDKSKEKFKEKAKESIKPPKPPIPNVELTFRYYQELRRVKLSKQMKKED